MSTASRLASEVHNMWLNYTGIRPPNVGIKSRMSDICESQAFQMQRCPNLGNMATKSKTHILIVDDQPKIQRSE